MSSNLFVNRTQELQELRLLWDKKSASLVVINGRRRIGKSRLITEFAENEKFYQFSGIFPHSQTTAQEQRDEFMRQFSLQFHLPRIKSEDWGDCFYWVSKTLPKGKVIVLLDEISWMGSKGPDFLAKLKHAWDVYFKNNPKLILILCGSISSWIDKNILKSAAFLGRVSLTITLQELSLKYCNQWLDTILFKGTNYEKFKLLAITGGVPRYLEEVNPKLTSDENIKRLCFKKGGILVTEFNDIFNDLFSKKSNNYKNIVKALIVKPLEYEEISHSVGIQKGSYLTDLLEDLIKLGFVQRHFTWQLKTAKFSKLSMYRLSDNYIRFYLKYIEPNQAKIEMGHFDDKSLGMSVGWDSMMGHQFENLVLNNRVLIQKLLHIKPEEVVADNPFFQHKTVQLSGVQIDYLIQTRFNTLFVCEIKFSRNQIQTQIIREMQDKLRRLKLPRGFSCFPILIHVNGVCDHVLNEGYFHKIIDFGQCLIGEEI